MAQRKPINPFYVLLVLAGVVFFITASAYGVMTVKGLYPERIDTSQDPLVPGDQIASPKPSSLMDWLDVHGFQLLMCELVFLAVFTFAAIGTDNYWSKADPKT